MTTLTSYDVVGTKEDISDVITNIDPTNTPFLSSIKDEKVTQKLYQWQEDSLKAVQQNAQAEGFTVVSSTRAPTLMRKNTTQILSDNAEVSGSLEATALHGRAKEMAYQLAKVSAELKRDLEYSMVGTRQTEVDGSDGNARMFAGVQALIDASTTVNASTLAGGNGSTPTALTEAAVLAADQALYTAGSTASLMHVKPADSLKVANFAYAAAGGVAQRSRMLGAGETTVTNAVDFYKSPFGVKRVVINRWLNTGDAILYDPKFWRRAVFRPWVRETMAKVGDKTTVMIVGEFGLIHKNFKASGLINELS